MPLSWGAPSHRLMRETLAGGGSGGTALGTAELRQAMDRDWVEAPEVYYDLLIAMVLPARLQSGGAPGGAPPDPDQLQPL